MKKQILGLIPVFAIFCKDKDNVLAGTMIAGTRVTDKILPSQKQINSTETVYSVHNHGKLEDGLINVNLLHCPKVKAAFEKVQDATKQSNCKVFHDLSILLVRICPKNMEKSSQAAGEYTSQVRILKTTNTHLNVRQVDFTLTLIFSVEMLDNSTKYMRCPLEKPQFDATNAEQAINTKAVSPSNDKKLLSNGKDGKEPTKTNRTRDPIYEFTLTNQNAITVVYLKKPLFLRVVMKRDPPPDENQTDCHSLKKEQHEEIIVKTRKCNADEVSKNVNLTTNLYKSVSMMFQGFKDERKHSILMYDNRVAKIPSSENEEQSREYGRDPRFVQLLVSSKVDIPRKISMTQLNDGKLFGFEFGKSSSRELIVFVGDTEEQQKENQMHEYIAADKTSSVAKQVKFSLINGESITNKKEAIEWTMNNEYPIKRPSTKYEAVHPVAKPCSSKQIACGIVAVEIFEEKNLSSPLPGITNQMMFLKTKKALNENGEEVGQKDDTEKKFLNRELPMNNDERATYETLIQMNPEFEKRIRNAIADIKRSITTRFGANVWKKAVYTSELLIGRQLSCISVSCTGSIRAMLEYNMTRKAKPIAKVSTVLHRKPAQSHTQPSPKSFHRFRLFLILTGRLFVHKQLSVIKVKDVAQKRKAPAGNTQTSTAKLFFDPVKKAPSDNSKKRDEFSKLNRMVNIRHFKLEKGQLSKDEKINLLMQLLSKRIEGYDLHDKPSDKEKLMMLKTLAQKSAVNAPAAGAGMCILVTFVIALLILGG